MRQHRACLYRCEINCRVVETYVGGGGSKNGVLSEGVHVTITKKDYIYWDLDMHSDLCSALLRDSFLNKDAVFRSRSLRRCFHSPRS